MKICVLQALNDEYPSAVTEMLKTAKLLEQSSTIIYLVVGQITPQLCITPRYIYSLYCYYVEDLGRNSFDLTFRMVW